MSSDLNFLTPSVILAMSAIAVPGALVSFGHVVGGTTKTSGSGNENGYELVSMKVVHAH